MQGLTKLLRIEFHYERQYKKYEILKTSITTEAVLMLMTRARKLYTAIETIMTMFKLLDRLKGLKEEQ